MVVRGGMTYLIHSTTEKVSDFWGLFICYKNKSRSISVETITQVMWPGLTNRVTYNSFIIKTRKCVKEIWKSHWYWLEIAARLSIIFIWHFDRWSVETPALKWQSGYRVYFHIANKCLTQSIYVKSVQCPEKVTLWSLRVNTLWYRRAGHNLS